MITYLDAPIVLIKAISDFLVWTNIIIDEIILKAATNIIKLKIINITFFSTAKALIKAEFLFFQSITINSFPNLFLTSDETKEVNFWSFKKISIPWAILFVERKSSAFFQGINIKLLSYSYIPRSKKPPILKLCLIGNIPNAVSIPLGEIRETKSPTLTLSLCPNL